MIFDLETYRAEDLHRRPDFLRLGGYLMPDGPRLTTDGDEIARMVERYGAAGHNIFAFDLAVLARHHGLDLTKIIGRCRDTELLVMLADPPPSGHQGSISRKLRPRGYYGLDQSCVRYGLPHKTDDVKAMGKRYAHGVEALRRLQTLQEEMDDPTLSPRRRTSLRGRIRTAQRVVDEFDPALMSEIEALTDSATRPDGKIDGFGVLPADDPAFRHYLRGDLEATDALVRRLHPLGAYAQREMVVGLITTQIQVSGFRIDLDVLADAVRDGEDRKHQNLIRLSHITGMPLEGVSPHRSGDGNRALRQALIDCGLPEGGLPTTPKTGMLKTGKDDLLPFLDKVKKFAGSRDTSKIEEIIRLIVATSGERTIFQTIDDIRVGDRAHFVVKPVQASGRWSSGALTVMGKREGRYVERRVFLPEDGHVLVAFDADQVDARGVAAHSGDESYVKIFTDVEAGERPDLHSAVALDLFGTLDMREACKPLNHGVNYGMGASKAHESTGLPLEVCKHFVEQLRIKYPRVVLWQDHVRELGREGALLDNGFGRRLRVDPAFYYTQSPALVGQGCTRDIMAEGLIRLPVEFWPYLRGIIHDEFVFSLPEADWEEMAMIIQRCMQFDLADVAHVAVNVPITVGISAPGRNWAQCYEKH